MSTEAKKDISTVARTVGVQTSGGFFTPPRRHAWTVLDSRELLWTLHNIKDKAVEEHTRKNIQALIDQIHGMGLDV